MDFVSTIIGILVIAVALAGAILYIWETKDKGKPSYMVEPKLTKEEKKALKQANAQAENEKPEKKEKKKVKKSK